MKGGAAAAAVNSNIVVTKNTKTKAKNNNKTRNQEISKQGVAAPNTANIVYKLNKNYTEKSKY